MRACHVKEHVLPYKLADMTDDEDHVRGIIGKKKVCLNRLPERYI